MYTEVADPEETSACLCPSVSPYMNIGEVQRRTHVPSRATSSGPLGVYNMSSTFHLLICCWSIFKPLSRDGYLRLTTLQGRATKRRSHPGKKAGYTRVRTTESSSDHRSARANVSPRHRHTYTVVQAKKSAPLESRRMVKPQLA